MVFTAPRNPEPAHIQGAGKPESVSRSLSRIGTCPECDGRLTTSGVATDDRATRIVGTCGRCKAAWTFSVFIEEK